MKQTAAGPAPTIDKSQLREFISNLTELAATSEQKIHGLDLMLSDLKDEPCRLRWEEMFGDRFTTGLRNWLDANRATEHLTHQGVLSQLKHHKEILERLESGLFLPVGYTIGQ